MDMMEQGLYGSSRSKESNALMAFAANMFGWGELFVLVGLQYFWILSKSSPLDTVNISCHVAAVAPFALMVLVGLFAALSRFGKALVLRLEWVFHLSVCVCNALLLLGLLFRDPFNMSLPASWLFYVWTFGVSFLLLANLAGRQRQFFAGDPVAKIAQKGMVAAMALLVWAGVLALAASMTWPIWFWLASTVFHAVMAPYCLHAAATPEPGALERARARRKLVLVLEPFTLITIFLYAHLRTLDVFQHIGTFEVKYFLALHPYVSALFVLGAAFAVVMRRRWPSLAAHALVLAVLAISGQWTAWLIPFCFGYCLVGLYRTTMRQCTFGYAVSAAFMALVWVFAMTGFTFAGLVMIEGYGREQVQHFAAGVRGAMIVLFLVLAGAVWLNGRAKYAPGKKNEPKPLPWLAPRTCRCAYVGFVAVVLLPAVFVCLSGAGYPLRMQCTNRVVVEEPCGVCHAGYSRSDAEYETLGRLGVQLMRVDFHWHSIQPAPDTWDIARWEPYLDAADKHGVKVLGILAFDNANVEVSPEGREKDKYIAPQDVPLFLEYVKRTVTHYKDRVYAWEIWNEPNIARFWDGPIEEFYELARATAETVNAVDPDTRLVGTAMAATWGAFTPTAIEGLHAWGALNGVDHPSMHLYVPDPRDYYGEFMKVIAAAKKHDHPGAFWITELGDPDGGLYPWRASSDLLAEHVIKSYAIATTFGIEKLVWYCYHDSSAERQMEAPLNSEAFFGLLDPDGQWKPAAYAYSLFSRHCSHSTLCPDLVQVAGGLAARQLRTALYRREDGASALILWYEPALRQGAQARVTLDLGELDAPALVHDITSDYTKRLLDDYVEVSSRPLLITFQSDDPEAPVHLDAASSVYDALLVVMLLMPILIAGSIAAKRHAAMKHEGAKRGLENRDRP